VTFRVIVAGIARIIATAFVTCALAWTLAELAPRSAAERAAGAAGALPPPDAPAASRVRAIERAADLHDLHGGSIARVARATARLAVLDLGRSWRDGRPVGATIRAALPVTLRIAVVALLVAIVAGTAAGVAASRARRPLASGVAGAAIALAAALPAPWIALGVLGIAPRAGELAAGIVLALAPGAAIATQVRAALGDFLAGPLAAAIRARGAGEGRVAIHGLRASLPALAPLLTIAGGYALGASVVVERAFALPGLGRVTLTAAAAGDAPVLAGVATLVGATVAALSVAATWLAAAADPRLEDA
jgi:peptide/nickel transport system permease protein